MTSERVVHFENCVSLEDEGRLRQFSRDDPFEEQPSMKNGNLSTLESHLSAEDFQSDEEKPDKWKAITKRVRGAILIKPSAVKPAKARRKSIWRTPTETIDPFIQKFSTRSDNRKTTPPKRKSSRTLQKISLGSTTDPGSQATVPDTILEIDSKEIESDNASTYDNDLGYSTMLFREIPKAFAPDGRFIYVWSFFVVFAMRYNLWVLIIRIAFPSAQEEFQNVWLVFDYFCDFIYFLDLLLSFRTGFLEEGILVTELNKIAKTYVKSKQFLADAFSLLPTDILFVLFPSSLPKLRLNRLVKSYKSLRIKSLMESHTNYPTFFRVFFLLHLMFLLINWNAGIYIMISRAEGFGTNAWVYSGNGSLYQQYLKSIYWSTLTLTAIGDLPAPATNVEYLYTIACYLCGVLMFATIVGHAGSIIVNRNASRMDFERQRESTKSYMQNNNVPRDLQRRVLMWYDYTWGRGRLGNSSYDLNSLTLLPDKLKTEIALHVNLETLSKVTFLQKCQPEFLHDLVLKMKLRIFTPGDYICRNGEVAKEMYVIINGKIEVVGDAGQVLKVLSGSDFFGEIGILSLSEGQNRRTADIRTIGYVECFVLSKDDVLNATRDYPEAQAVLAEYGRRRLQGQSTCEDPRLVDMDDCNTKSTDRENVTENNNDNSNQSLNARTNRNLAVNEPHTSSSSTPSFLHSSQLVPGPTSNFLGGRRSSRGGLLDPLSPRPGNQISDKVTSLSGPDSENMNEMSKNVDDLRQDFHSGDDDDAILKMMTSSLNKVVNYANKVHQKRMEAEMDDVHSQLRTLSNGIYEKDNIITNLTRLLSTQETELEAWKDAVHELEEKRAEECEQSRKLGKEIEILKRQLQCCTTSPKRLRHEEDTLC